MKEYRLEGSVDGKDWVVLKRVNNEGIIELITDKDLYKYHREAVLD
jgi:hypothetical protein